MEFNKFLTLHFFIILYISLHRNILEAVLAYDLVKIRFKEKKRYLMETLMIKAEESN